MLREINKYLSSLEVEGKAENTIKTYRFHLEKLNMWLVKENEDYRTLSVKEAKEFKEALLKESTPHTINSIFGACRGFYEYLHFKEIVSFNPFPLNLRMKAKRNRTVFPLDPEELEIIIAHVCTMQQNVKLAFLTIIFTGIRVGEAVKLKKSDFHIVDGRLFVRIHETKGGIERNVPFMNANVAQEVCQYLQEIENKQIPVFRVARRTVQRHAQRISEKNRN